MQATGVEDGQRLKKANECGRQIKIFISFVIMWHFAGNGGRRQATVKVGKRGRQARLGSMHATEDLSKKTVAVGRQR